jgi:hypothetical protein
VQPITDPEQLSAQSVRVCARVRACVSCRVCPVQDVLHAVTMRHLYGGEWRGGVPIDVPRNITPADAVARKEKKERRRVERRIAKRATAAAATATAVAAAGGGGGVNSVPTAKILKRNALSARCVPAAPAATAVTTTRASMTAPMSAMVQAWRDMRALMRSPRSAPLARRVRTSPPKRATRAKKTVTPTRALVVSSNANYDDDDDDIVIVGHGDGENNDENNDDVVVLNLDDNDDDADVATVADDEDDDDKHNATNDAPVAVRHDKRAYRHNGERLAVQEPRRVVKQRRTSLDSVHNTATTVDDSDDDDDNNNNTSRAKEAKFALPSRHAPSATSVVSDCTVIGLFTRATERPCESTCTVALLGRAWMTVCARAK